MSPHPIKFCASLDIINKRKRHEGEVKRENKGKMEEMKEMEDGIDGRVGRSGKGKRRRRKAKKMYTRRTRIEYEVLMNFAKTVTSLMKVM